jgi:hypothetical protein
MGTVISEKKGKPTVSLKEKPGLLSSEEYFRGRSR